jgi:hypothetical protein
VSGQALTKMKLFKRILIGLVIALVGLAALAAWRIGPRNVVGMIRYDQRKEGNLRVGDAAPDVELVAPDGARRVRLKEFVGAQPLVLVFGSYT